MRFSALALIACALSSIASAAGAETYKLAVCEPFANNTTGTFSQNNRFLVTSTGVEIPLVPLTGNTNQPAAIVCGPAPDASTSMWIAMRTVEISTGGGSVEVGPLTFDNSEQLFAFAFGAVILFWATGLGIGAVLSLLRQRD